MNQKEYYEKDKKRRLAIAKRYYQENRKEILANQQARRDAWNALPRWLKLEKIAARYTHAFPQET